MMKKSILLTIALTTLAMSTTEAFAADKKCRGSLRFSRTSKCDADRDGLTNKQESKYHTNLRRADTDSDGLSDGEEVKKFHTNPLDPDTDNNCVYDGNDDSNNNGRSDEDEDEHHSYSDDDDDHESRSASSGEDSDDDRIVPNCNGSGSNGGGNGSGQNCTVQSPIDSSGNTTAFGIPTGYTGNVNSGLSQFNVSCAGCHDTSKGRNWSFSALKSAVEGPKMNIRNLSAQQFANLTAFVNRTNTSGGAVVCN